MVGPTPIQTTLSGISRFIKNKIKKTEYIKFRGKSGGDEMVGTWKGRKGYGSKQITQN